MPLDRQSVLGLGVVLVLLQPLRCLGFKVHADAVRSSKCFGLGYCAAALTTLKVSRA